MQKRKTLTVKALPANICLLFIWLYRTVISPLKPQTCRFYPSCSNYCYDAIQQYGFIRGSALGVKRLLKCHPLNPGGYDPVR